MDPFIVIALISSLAFLALVVAALSRHKKAGSGTVKLIGEPGRVETRLAPEGTVIVAGELWRARSSDGNVIEVDQRVHIVAFQDQFALANVCDANCKHS